MASLSIYEKIGKNIDSLIFSKAVTTNNDKHSAPAANDHLVLDDDDDQDDDQDGHGDDSESYRSVAGDPNHNNDSIFAPAVELEEVDVVSGKETAAFAANPSGGNVINVTDGSGDNNDIWQNDFGNLDDDNIKDAKLSDDAGTSGLGKNGKARSNNALQIDGHIGVRIEELQLEMVIHNSVEETFDEANTDDPGSNLVGSWSGWPSREDSLCLEDPSDFTSLAKTAGSLLSPMIIAKSREAGKTGTKEHKDGSSNDLSDLLKKDFAKDVAPKDNSLPSKPVPATLSTSLAAPASSLTATPKPKAAVSTPKYTPGDRLFSNLTNMAKNAVSFFSATVEQSGVGVGDGKIVESSSPVDSGGRDEDGNNAVFDDDNITESQIKEHSRATDDTREKEKTDKPFSYPSDEDEDHSSAPAVATSQVTVKIDDDEEESKVIDLTIVEHSDNEEVMIVEHHSNGDNAAIEIDGEVVADNNTAVAAISQVIVQIDNNEEESKLTDLTGVDLAANKRSDDISVDDPRDNGAYNDDEEENESHRGNQRVACRSRSHGPPNNGKGTIIRIKSKGYYYASEKHISGCFDQYQGC